ncbi:copper chaperone [Paenibacillus shirakamiensis]|uniref:Copper chaperone n=1 Tax=Paenibacillus shirakamiensis TaxID=1265935 RepID=A0ABS4JFT3_9BACL|nr:copper ion binding protein [Paenibacillus shirakamiensis]MBP1999981.1 copper chaperone [Paenibacillus shirakamiensis]
MRQQTFQVEGMSCQHCVISIESALKEIGAAGRVNLASNTVEVSYEENQVSIEVIKEAIEEQGYDVV